MINFLSSTAEYSNIFVVLMGLGTVFAGLVLIILSCYIMGLFMKNKASKTKEADSKAPVTPVASASPIENKQELVAAISAAVAENLGRDVSAIRILSIKKV